MNSTALLVVLGLMLSVNHCHVLHCTPTTICGPKCKVAQGFRQPHLTANQALQNSSVAPWRLINDSEENREPQDIMKAQCMGCTVANMIAKAITISTVVYEKKIIAREIIWCRCPYELAVGCTCVSK